jgi:hypothetical protein
VESWKEGRGGRADGRQTHGAEADVRMTHQVFVLLSLFLGVEIEIFIN